VAVSRGEGAPLDAAFVAALDRQDAQRRRGGAVLSVIAGGPGAAMDWAAWAAGRGYLTLVTEGAGLDATVEELLAQVPWLRCVAMARRSLAAAAQLHVDALDAAIDARSEQERERWIDDIAGLDPQVRVSGWLLAALRGPAAGAPAVTTAPVQGGELLAALCELAAPMAVLVQHPGHLDPGAASSSAWLQRALATAAALVSSLPGHPVAVGAPDELVTRVLGGGRPSASLSMARQGLVRAPGAGHPRRAADPIRERIARALHEALELDPRTRRRFERGVRLRAQDGGPILEVDLVANAARLAVVIDHWYHLADPQGYRREREAEVRLSRAGYFVMRFAAEDIGARLAVVINEIALGLTGRGAAAALRGGR
jgi:very-short-patch-repair endonuclease